MTASRRIKGASLCQGSGVTSDASKVQKRLSDARQVDPVKFRQRFWHSPSLLILGLSQTEDLPMQYAQSNLLSFLAHAPVAVTTNLDHGTETPSGHILMNAARPLLGQTTFQGDFLRGRFYATLDPEDSISEIFARENLKLDGKVVFVVDRATATELILDGCRYRSQYMAMEEEERWSILGDRISDLQDMPLAGFMEKLAKVKGSAAESQTQAA